MTIDEICDWLHDHRDELARALWADPTGLDEAERKIRGQLERLRGGPGVSALEFGNFLDTLLDLPPLSGRLPGAFDNFLSSDIRASPRDFEAQTRRIVETITFVENLIVAARPVPGPEDRAARPQDTESAKE